MTAKVQMFETPEDEQSLLEIVDDRADTVFRGRETTAPRAGDSGVDTIEDEFGQHYTNPHDYVKIERVDGLAVGIFIADIDDKSCGVDHEYTELPHLMGLYVREEYRGRGIATELIDEFMHSVETDACVVDCARRMIPFYLELDWDIIWLESVKDGNDPTTPPLTEIDTVSSPVHDIPMFDRGNGEEEEYVEACRRKNEPAVYMGVSERTAEDRLPKSQRGLEEGTVQKYATWFQGEVTACEVVVHYDTCDQFLSESATEQLSALLEEYGSDRWHYIDGQAGAEEAYFLTDDQARELADEVYEIVTDESNLLEESPVI